MKPTATPSKPKLNEEDAWLLIKCLAVFPSSYLYRSFAEHMLSFGDVGLGRKYLKHIIDHCEEFEALFKKADELIRNKKFDEAKEVVATIRWQQESFGSTAGDDIALHFDNAVWEANIDV